MLFEGKFQRARRVQREATGLDKEEEQERRRQQPEDIGGIPSEAGAGQVFHRHHRAVFGGHPRQRGKAFHGG